MLISGTAERIDVKDLQKNTKYRACSSSDKYVKMFWKMMSEMNEENKAKVLKFVTSCSRPPLFGFKNLQPTFTIQKVAIQSDEERLPTAGTCFNLLKLPTYSALNVMKQKFEYAISSNSGFELS